MKTFVRGASVIVLAIASAIVAGFTAYGCLEGAWITLTLDSGVDPELSSTVGLALTVVGALACIATFALVFCLAWPRAEQTRARYVLYT